MTQNPSLRRLWSLTQSPYRTTLIALIFWLTSYLILSLWSALRVDASFPIVSGPRFFATLVGAVAFGFIVARLEKTPSNALPNPLAVIPAVLPVALAVLLTSLVCREIWPNDAIQFNDHLRWVMIWAGYFGTGLGLYLAWLAYGRMCIVRSAAARGEPQPIREMDQRERAIEALAAELAATPESARAMLVGRLTSERGYALADDVLGTESARAAVIARIARRMPRR